MQRMQQIPNPNDRRVLRTRQALRTALISLIAEQGWDDVGVQAICDRANIGRSTFYTHFGDKEDLLVSGFDDLRAMLVALRPPTRPKHVARTFSAPLLQHAYENRMLFRALAGKRSGLVVQRHFRKLVVDLTMLEFADTYAGEPTFVVRYLAGAFFELVSAWLDAQEPQPPGDLDVVFQQLTLRGGGTTWRAGLPSRMS